MKFIFIALLVITHQASATETSEFASAEIKKVHIESMAGRVTVGVSKTDKSSASIEKREFAENCKTEIKKDRETLKVRVYKKGMSFAKCEADITVSAPGQVDLVVESSSSDIKIVGTEGAIEYRVASGQLDIDAKIKSLVGQSSSGKAKIKGLEGTATLQSASGPFDITYNHVPEEGKLTVQTTSGDATIYMPKDAKIKSQKQTLMGQLENEIGDTAAAKFEVSYQAAKGNLYIKAKK